MAQFLSDDYMTEATAHLAQHSGFGAAIANTDLTLQFLVTDSPEGEIPYFVEVSEGTAAVGRGSIDNFDVKITHTYETAVGISKGEINTQMAFMTGKLKVEGNTAKLLMNQAMLGEFANAMSEVPVDY